jgi:hypothetical protein
LNNIIRKITLLACLLASPMMLTAMTATQTADGYISISGSDCSDTLTDRMHNAVALDCKTYHQTTNYTCGPAAVMTLMHFYKKYSDSDMNPRTELHIALEMGATDTGTSLSQMSSWLSSHGFEVETGSRVDSAKIIENLKNKIPTIITVNHHWILAKGYAEGDESNPQTIFFSDSCCGTSELKSADIDKLWQTAEIEKLHGNNCIDEGQYIIAKPR